MGIAPVAVTDHDHRTGYCRMLGHHLSFAYCRKAGDGDLCPKVLDCWFETFEVLDFVSRYHPEALNRTQLPKPKVATLLELIQQAQQRAG